MYQNRELLNALRPKSNEFVQSEIPSSYRAKSTQSKRYVEKKQYSNENIENTTRVTLSTTSSKRFNKNQVGSRVILIRRNGKKPEKLDDDVWIAKHHKQSTTHLGYQQDQLNTASSGAFQQKRHSHDNIRSQPSEDGLFSQEIENQLNQDKPYEQQSEQQYEARSQGKLCFTEADPSLLDYISLNDPIWQNIIPENLIDQNDVERLIEDNPDYFNHQLQMCACFRCKCGTCKCTMQGSLKLKLNGSMVSIYGKEFVQKNGVELNNLNPLGASVYETRFLNQKTIDKVTQSQVAFNVKQVPKIERYQQKFIPPVGQVSNMTSYRQNYGNWGADDFTLIKHQQHISTSEDIPFLGQSTYKQNFCQQNKIQPDRQVIFKNQLSPFPSGPFIGATTSEKAFQPFRVSKQQNLPPPGDKNYYKTPCYQGQYLSTATKAFGGEKDEYCPAIKYNKEWKYKILQKYKQLNDLKEKKILSVNCK